MVILRSSFVGLNGNLQFNFKILKMIDNIKHIKKLLNFENEGDFYMLYIFGIILFFSAVLCLYKAWSTSPIQVNESDMKNALSQLPIIGNAEMQLSRREAVRVSLLKSADLSTSKDFDRGECAIC